MSSIPVALSLTIHCTRKWGLTWSKVASPEGIWTAPGSPDPLSHYPPVASPTWSLFFDSLTGGVPVNAHRFVSWAFGTRLEDAGIFSGRRTPPQRPRQGAAVPCFFAPPSAARPGPGPQLVLAFFCKKVYAEYDSDVTHDRWIRAALRSDPTVPSPLAGPDLWAPAFFRSGDGGMDRMDRRLPEERHGPGPGRAH